MWNQLRHKYGIMISRYDTDYDVSSVQYMYCTYCRSMVMIMLKLCDPVGTEERKKHLYREFILAEYNISAGAT